MANSKIDLASAASRLLGTGSFSSFNENQVAISAGELIDDRINYLLSEYPWRFCMRYVQLSKLNETPPAQWASVHGFPSDRVEPFPFALYNSEGENAPPFKHFTVAGSKVYSNETTLFCQYRVRPPVAEWPPHFVGFAIVDLAFYLAIPLTRDKGKSEHWERIARGTPSEEGKGGMFRTATNEDAKQKPPEQFVDEQLVAARMGASPTFR